MINVTEIIIVQEDEPNSSVLELVNWDIELVDEIFWDGKNLHYSKNNSWLKEHQIANSQPNHYLVEDFYIRTDMIKTYLEDQTEKENKLEKRVKLTGGLNQSMQITDVTDMPDATEQEEKLHKWFFLSPNPLYFNEPTLRSDIATPETSL